MLGRTVQPIRPTKRRFGQNSLAESSDIPLTELLRFVLWPTTKYFVSWRRMASPRAASRLVEYHIHRLARYYKKKWSLSVHLQLREWYHLCSCRLRGRTLYLCYGCWILNKITPIGIIFFCNADALQHEERIGQFAVDLPLAEGGDERGVKRAVFDRKACKRYRREKVKNCGPSYAGPRLLRRTGLWK